MTLNNRTPIPFTDDEDIPCLKVPLDNTGEAYALIWTADYHRVVFDYEATHVWYATGNGSRLQYVAVSGPNDPDGRGWIVPIARLVMKAKERERVFYLNGDRFDLRRSNLVLRTGGGRAKHDAVQRFLAAKWERRARLAA